jgi:hypothetical protein
MVAPSPSTSRVEEWKKDNAIESEKPSGQYLGLIYDE